MTAREKRSQFVSPVVLLVIVVILMVGMVVYTRLFFQDAKEDDSNMTKLRERARSYNESRGLSPNDPTNRVRSVFYTQDREGRADMEELRKRSETYSPPGS